MLPLIPESHSPNLSREELRLWKRLEHAQTSLVDLKGWLSDCGIDCDEEIRTIHEQIEECWQGR